MAKWRSIIAIPGLLLCKLFGTGVWACRDRKPYCLTFSPPKVAGSVSVIDQMRRDKM